MSSNPGIEPMSPVKPYCQADSFTTEPPGKPHTCHTFYHMYRLHSCLLYTTSLITTMTLVKITADGDCSHEIRRWLLFGRKAMTNLDSVLKGKDIILPTNIHIVKAILFPLVKYGCESWTTGKAEHWRIDVFEMWCWRRLLRVPWAVRSSNQSILKEINPKYSLEGLILKLKLQYFVHLMLRSDSLKKTLMMGKIEGKRGRGWQRMRWLGGTTNLMDMNLSKLQEIVRDRELQSMGSQKVRHNLVTEQLLLTFKDSVFSNLQTR